MNQELQQVALRRLSNATGHLKGIERMVAEDAYCVDVIRQIQAVQSALTKVSAMLLENHLRTCVTTAIQGNDPVEQERMIREVASVFTVSPKGE